MTAPVAPIRGAAEGDDFGDICSKGVDCPCCALWQQPNEDRATWLARVGRMYHAAPLHNTDWREGVA